MDPTHPRLRRCRNDLCDALSAMTEASGNTKWWLLGGAALLIPMSCCCGMFVLGLIAPAPPPSATPATAENAQPVTAPPATELDAAPPENVPVEASAPGAAPAAAAADEPASDMADPGLPGIGATREHWEATHRRVPGFAPGVVFGPMVPSSEDGRPIALYANVMGDERITHYSLNLARGTTFEIAQARVRAELPPDAREVSTRRLRECRFIRYRSAAMRGLFRSEAHRGDVEVGFFSTTDDDRFTARAVSYAIINFHMGFDVDC